MFRPRPLSPRNILLYSAGGSIALHLTVFTTSPLWWTSMSLPSRSTPVELLMIETNTIATSPIATSPVTTSPVTTSSIINTADINTPPRPIAAIATRDHNTTPAQIDSEQSSASTPEPSTDNASDNPSSPDQRPPDQRSNTDSQKGKGIAGHDGEAGSTTGMGDATETEGGRSEGRRVEAESRQGTGNGVGRGTGNGVGRGTGNGVGRGTGNGVGRGTGNGVGRGTGNGVGQGTGNGVGRGTGNGVGQGTRGAGYTRPQINGNSDIPDETSPGGAGATACTHNCQGRYHDSEAETIERDPLIRAYRNADGELEFELMQSSGNAAADRAALDTAQQASYTSDRDEFTIRARIADANSDTTAPTSESVSDPASTTNDEPVYEEPVYEEPIYEEPVYEEPVYEEPVYEEPVYEEPIYEEPVYEEPIYEEPISEESNSLETDVEAETETSVETTETQ